MPQFKLLLPKITLHHTFLCLYGWILQLESLFILLSLRLPAAARLSRSHLGCPCEVTHIFASADHWVHLAPHPDPPAPRLPVVYFAFQQSIIFRKSFQSRKSMVAHHGELFLTSAAVWLRSLGAGLGGGSFTYLLTSLLTLFIPHLPPSFIFLV